MPEETSRGIADFPGEDVVVVLAVSTALTPGNASAACLLIDLTRA